MSQPTGGPAFPLFTDPRSLPSGMSLREYIAIAAMQALIQGSSYQGDVQYDVKSVVESAFTMADAMLEEARFK